jgi:cyclophilin family peptidyl-prolyl cis-trans isomerase
MRGVLGAMAVLLGVFGYESGASAQAAAAQARGLTKPSPLAPSEIVATAPASDWVAIAPSDLLVMDLAPLNGKARRVVIQLIPAPFSQGWVGNIRKLAAAHWWDGLAVTRVQDNYVAQWGDPNGETPQAKPLPPGLVTVPESEYQAPSKLSSLYNTLARGHMIRETGHDGSIPQRDGPPDDQYATVVGFIHGWPAGGFIPDQLVQPPAPPNVIAWPVHCYGMVGVGRNLSPDTGSGAELYTVIGHAPRHLDRNIALVGRVISGIENLSSLPRGTAALGVYATPAEHTPIVSIRLGNEVADLPRYEYLSTESASFARYADARANRKDDFFIVPAGGADICNIPVPVRKAP